MNNEVDDCRLNCRKLGNESSKVVEEIRNKCRTHAEYRMQFPNWQMFNVDSFSNVLLIFNNKNEKTMVVKMKICYVLFLYGSGN